MVAGECLSSCLDYWDYLDCGEVPVACAEKGWMSYLVHPNNSTFLRGGNQLTLAAQCFVNWMHVVKILMSIGERMGTGTSQIKKYQIKEDLLHLPFTHTFPRCLRDFTHKC